MKSQKIVFVDRSNFPPQNVNLSDKKVVSEAYSEKFTIDVLSSPDAIL